MPHRMTGPILLITAAVAAAASPATRPTGDGLFDPARHLRVADVRPGMTGYGLSVFRGTVPERFDVEVVSVLHNQEGPGRSVVLIRCRGQGLEHSGAVEGMSGSPVYLDCDDGKARLIGAFALGWEHGLDPLAGVRPIEEMLRVPTDERPVAASPPQGKQPTTWNAVPLMRTVSGPLSRYAGGGLGRRSARTATDSPSSKTPSLTLPRRFERGEPTALALPVRPGSTTRPTNVADAKLVPGAAVGIPVVTGDLDVSALGTVTEVLGDRVYAFGHEFNGEGGVDLPFGLGYVHAVIPARTISFKMGSLVRLDGTLRSDETAAVAGTVGRVPAMIPVTVAVRTDRRDDAKTFDFNVTRHPKLTPMGLSTALTSAVTGDNGLPGEFTVRYAIDMTFDNGQSVTLADTATSADGAAALQRDLNLPLTLALHNPFGRSYPTRVSATFDVVPRVMLQTIDSAAADKSVYAPGETAGLFVTTQAQNGGRATTRVELKLPADLPDGDYTVGIGDADHALADATRDAPYRYQARTPAEVFGVIREACVRPSTRLYLRLAGEPKGVSVGRTPLRDLPASQRRVLARSPRTDVQTFTAATTRTVDWPTPLAGSAGVTIRVSKRPDQAARPVTAMPTP